MRRVRVACGVLLLVVPVCWWLAVNAPSIWITAPIAIAPFAVVHFAMSRWAVRPDPHTWTDDEIRRMAWETAVVTFITWTCFFGLLTMPPAIQATGSLTLPLAAVLYLLSFPALMSVVDYVRDRIMLPKQRQAARGSIDVKVFE